MTGFFLNMTEFFNKYDWICPKIAGLDLNMTGFVLTMAEFVLNMTGFVLYDRICPK